MKLGRFTTDVTTPVAVAAGGTITFNNTTVNSPAISYDNGIIYLNQTGTYVINSSFTTTATAVNNQEIQLYRSGNPVAGSHAVESAGSIGDETNLSFDSIVTVTGCCYGNPVSLAYKSANATSISIADVVISKVS